jgi:MFS family permease
LGKARAPTCHILQPVIDAVPPPQEPLLTRPFVLVALSNLFQAISFNLFIHFPGFLSELGAREAQIGLLFGLSSFAAVAIRPTLGHLMDTRGRRGVILFGNALNTAVMALYLTVDSIGPWIYCVRVLHGISEAALFTALFTYAADCVPERRRMQGLMLFGVSGMLPIALGGLLGDVLLARADFRLLFEVALGLAALAALLALPLPEMNASGADPGDRDPPAGFRKVLLQPRLVTVWALTACFSTALAAMFTFLRTYVDTTGIGSVGGFFGAYSAVAITLRLGAGWLPDRVGAKNVLYPALVTLFAGFLTLAFASSARDVLLAGALCGAGHGYTFPLLFGMVVNRARSADRGSAMAIYTALFDVGILIGGPLLGAVIEAQGYTAMFLSAAGLVAIGTAGFAVADRGRP